MYYRKSSRGGTENCIDFDMLRQELSDFIVEGNEDRYQFTWPDKKESVLLANAPINKTLRPCREESVGRDGKFGGFDSENLYIEGDNLQVLKLLQETYLGKIKMIYIDPPYNTGNDFVYSDYFAQNVDKYLENSGQFDEEGNRMVQNTECNGRFHTDWLNMIYPRLKLAKDLLTDDGLILVSIGDVETSNLKKIMDEVWGETNFISQINIITGANQSGEGVLIQKNVEYCFIYAKNIAHVDIKRVDRTEEAWRNLNDAPTSLETRMDMGYTIYYNVKTNEMIPVFDYDKSQIHTNDVSKVYKDDINFIENGFVPIRPGKRNGKLHRWRWGIDTFEARKKEVKMFIGKNGYVPKFMQSGYNAPKNIQSFAGGVFDLKKLFGNQVPFEYPKGVALLKYLVSIATKSDSIILDFFSGSATTAQAVMQLNIEDAGNRKFIMVQFPEGTNEKSEAYKAGYKNICEIGKERIRRAGKQIKEETGADIDYGFRVLKCDSSNMKDVYYNPEEYQANMFNDLTDNIKEDRTAEDLLFQVMLDLGVELSSKIEEKDICGKKVFNVADGFLIACFDKEVTENVVIEIAKENPYYFVMRDSSMATDSVATNFEQIFKTYSPDTIRKVL